MQKDKKQPQFYYGTMEPVLRNLFPNTSEASHKTFNIDKEFLGYLLKRREENKNEKKALDVQIKELQQKLKN